MVLFADAPRRKPNHAVVPLLTKDDNREIRSEIHLRRNRRNRLFDNLLFHRLTLLIQAVQVGGNGSRFGFVLRRQEFDALFGGFKPPARVQSRRKAEAQMPCIDGLADLRQLHELFQPRTRACPHAHHAFADDDAVFLHQRHNIRDGREGGEVNPLFDAVHAQQRLRDFERDPRAAQPLERIRLNQRIQHCIGFGQLFRQLVMVGDDDGHATLFRQRDFIEIGDAAVHGQQQSAFLREQLNRVGVQPIALFVARGDIRADVLCAEVAQGFEHDARRADAVDIVVAVDGDAPLLPDGLADDGYRLLHAGHGGGVKQIGQARMQEALCFLRGIDAPIAEEA